MNIFRILIMAIAEEEELLLRAYPKPKINCLYARALRTSAVLG
jgi:hypothetical protein